MRNYRFDRATVQCFYLGLHDFLDIRLQLGAANFLDAPEVLADLNWFGRRQNNRFGVAACGEGKFNLIKDWKRWKFIANLLLLSMADVIAS